MSECRRIDVLSHAGLGCRYGDSAQFMVIVVAKQDRAPMTHAQVLHSSGRR